MVAIHNTISKNLIQMNIPSQEVRDKPKGLWYGIDDSWIEWCDQNMPHWIRPNNFILEIDYSKMLVIDDSWKLHEFTLKYQKKAHKQSFYTDINWPAVAEKYCGIEIAPYQWSCRLQVSWYYGWDCASGCVWNSQAITEVTKMKKIKKEGQ